MRDWEVRVAWVLGLVVCFSACRTSAGDAAASFRVEGDVIEVWNVPPDVALDDPRVINAVLTHALTSQGDVARSRGFYSGDGSIGIAYGLDEFQDGFVPEVTGVELTAWDGDRYYESIREDVFPDDNYMVVSYHVMSESRHDLIVGFTNVGGFVRDGKRVMIIGGSSNYYDVARRGDVLELRYAGTFDP